MSLLSKILLVDDDPQALSSTERMLRFKGEQVLTAKNGQEALELIQSKNQNIGLVVTDVRMPRMGYVVGGSDAQQMDSPQLGIDL